MNVFTAAERREHEEIVRRLFGSIQAVRELGNGYAFQLSNSSATLSLAARFINNERLCCPFFGFTIELEPSNGNLWLQLTGSAGVKPFILAEFDEVLAASITQPMKPFDFTLFKSAVIHQNVSEWIEFFADEAEWIEYRHAAPPRAPHRMIGKPAIKIFLDEVIADQLQLTITDEVINATRAAFCLTCTLADGRQIIENTIVHLKDGKITRYIEVEASD